VRHDERGVRRKEFEMNLALVGLGYWGGKVLRNLVALLGAEHVVAIDQSEELVDWAQANYPGLVCSPTLEQALADHDAMPAWPHSRFSPAGRCSSRNPSPAPRRRRMSWPSWRRS
jgi:hypothetical protein